MIEEASEGLLAIRSPRQREIIALAREGMAAARAGDYETGLRILGEVCDRLRQDGDKLPATVISYYGLCLALHKAKNREAVEFCQAAIEAEPMKADHYANLAEVCIAGRSRRKAYSAIERGLAVDPTYMRLLRLQAKLGSRRPPLFASLDRAHPLNVVFGRIRHALAGPPKPPGAK